MATIGTQRKSKKQQALDAELGLIIDEMGCAMWNANKEYIGRSTDGMPLTESMRFVLYKFQGYCQDNYGQKA